MSPPPAVAPIKGREFETATGSGSVDLSDSAAYQTCQVRRAYFFGAAGFPAPGVVFKDLSPVLADADGFAAVIGLPQVLKTATAPRGGNVGTPKR